MSSAAQAKAKAPVSDFLITFSEDDVKKLQKKREKDGLCPLCGDVRTHKKSVMRMVPETIHGEVYQGVCLKCNPTPNLANVNLSYGNGSGWERTIRATDFKFRWQRSLKPSSCLDIAYVRKVEILGGEKGICTGILSLVPPEDVVTDSMVECCDGRTLVSFKDIATAQKLDLDSKQQWFHDACDRFCLANDGQESKYVRQNYALKDSIEAIMTFTRNDLRKTWTFEGEREKWYESVIEQVFCTEAEMWQKCAIDETRVEINFYSSFQCADSKFFRFVGRILGRALVDRQVVKYRLAKHLYMLLLGWPIVLEDLKDLDARYYTDLKSLEQKMHLLHRNGNHQAAQEAPNMSGLARVPNGSSAVDEKNVLEYINSCFQYRMFGRYQAQLSELVLGFLEVIPEPLLAVFDYQELEAALCGSYMGGISEAKGDSGQTTENGEQPMDATVRLAPQHTVSSSSYPPAIPVPEALLVEEELYDAIAEPIQTDRGSEQNSSEISYRLKKGRCPTCGMQTHKLTGVLKKSFRPLSNEHVLNGRCLMCHPIHSQVQEKDELVGLADKASNCVDDDSMPHQNGNNLGGVATSWGTETETELSLTTSHPHPTAPPFNLTSDVGEKTRKDETKTSHGANKCGATALYEATALAMALDQFPSTNPYISSTVDIFDNAGTYDYQHEIVQAQASLSVSTGSTGISGSDEVKEWLLSHLPTLQNHDVEKYCEHLIQDGFDCIAMMEHLEDGDLKLFMKKAHRRALMKRLNQN